MYDEMPKQFSDQKTKPAFLKKHGLSYKESLDCMKIMEKFKPGDSNNFKEVKVLNEIINIDNLLVKIRKQMNTKE